MRPYKLKPLAGLEVSFTNFPARDRLLLQKMVEQAGATYSAELFKGRTTHLLCHNGSGKKYRLVGGGWVGRGYLVLRMLLLPATGGKAGHLCAHMRTPTVCLVHLPVITVPLLLLLLYVSACHVCSAAMQWRSVHVVTDGWLRESMTLGFPAPESSFRVEPVLTAPR